MEDVCPLHRRCLGLLGQQQLDQISKQGHSLRLTFAGVVLLDVCAGDILSSKEV